MQSICTSMLAKFYSCNKLVLHQLLVFSTLTNNKMVKITYSSSKVVS
jgi:hypothetical protein